MWILYAHFILLGNEHFKAQSVHNALQECIKAANVLHIEHPEFDLKCIVAF